MRNRKADRVPLHPAISGEHPHPGVLLHELVRTQPVPYSLQVTPDPRHHKAPSTPGAGLQGQRPPGVHILQPEREAS